MSQESKRKKHSHPGNKNGIKIKDPDLRQKAVRAFCDHLASGYPREAFFFDHPTHPCCWKTVQRYIAENPTEFPSYLMEQAMAKRYKFWLDKGNALMEGHFKGGSPVVWQTIMRNIFKDVGWDREQIAQDSKPHVQRLANAIRNDTFSKAEDSNSAE